MKDIENTTVWLREKKYYDRTEEELETVLENLKKKYGVLIIRGTLDEDSNKIQAQRAETNTAAVYDDLDENTTHEEIMKKTEMAEYGFIGLSDPEQAELKELRTSLNELCYSVFSILENPQLNIDKDHKKELRDFIDDSLLWICSHEKPTKIDYKQKIDEVNDACDKILNEYVNQELFKEESTLLSESNTKREELENLCYTIKVMLDEKTVPLKTEDYDNLNNLINKTLEKISTIEETQEEIQEEEMNLMIDEINILCTSAYNKIQGINLDRNIFCKNDVIIMENDKSEEIAQQGGTSIESLIKQRQVESIEQLIIDKVDEKVEINIDEVLDEYNELN